MLIKQLFIYLLKLSIFLIEWGLYIHIIPKLLDLEFGIMTSLATISYQNAFSTFPTLKATFGGQDFFLEN